MRRPEIFNNRASRWHWLGFNLGVIAIVGTLFLTNHTTYAKEKRLGPDPSDPTKLIVIRASFKDLFQQYYPQFIKKDTDPATTPGSANLYSCKACHIKADPIKDGSAFNEFGNEIDKQYLPPQSPTPQQEIDALNKALDAIVKNIYSGNPNAGIDEEDPDNDSFTNFEEIVAGTFPGNIASKPLAAFTITMSASQQTVVAGELVTFTFIVSNIGTVHLTNIAIAVPNVCTANVADLAHGSSQSTTCTFKAKDSLNNVAATASADAAKLKKIPSLQPSNAVSLKVEPANPAVAITVVPNRSQVTSGQNVNFTITVSNTGNTPLSSVTVNAPRTPDCNRTFSAEIPTKQALPYICGVTISEDVIDVRNGEYFVFSRVAVSASNSLAAGDSVSNSFTVSLDATSRVMLPLIVAPLSATADGVNLIVTSISVSNQDVKVVIKNQGDLSLSGIGYWVDLYINPTVVPSKTNQLSEDWGDSGLVWGVSSDAAVLPPGGELTLHLNDRYFAGSHSSFPAQIPEGTKIYAQVDSANSKTDYGTVLETHERDGGDYDNIYSIVLTSLVSTAQWRTGVSSSATTPSLLEEQAPRR